MSRQRRILGIRIDPRLIRTPLVCQVARGAGVSVPQALGHLIMLWGYAADHAPDGDLSRLAFEQVEEQAGWKGPDWGFFGAAVEAGFIEDDPATGAIKLRGWRRGYEYVYVTVPGARQGARTGSNGAEATRTPGRPLKAVEGG